MDMVFLALRGRISELEKEVTERERRGRELEDRLKEEERKVERENANVKRLEEEMNREREVASERLKTTEQNLTHAYVSGLTITFIHAITVVKLKSMGCENAGMSI